MHTSHYSRLEKPTIYTACHPRKTTTYILHVVSITAHTHDRRKSIEKKKQKTIRRERKGKKRDESEKGKGKKEKEKGKERKEKTRKARKGKTRGESEKKKKKKKKREKKKMCDDAFFIRACFLVASSHETFVREIRLFWGGL